MQVIILRDANSNDELVPIPSQLNREKFTIGAFDNFNHMTYLQYKWSVIVMTLLWSSSKIVRILKR